MINLKNFHPINNEHINSPTVNGNMEYPTALMADMKEILPPNNWIFKPITMKNIQINEKLPENTELVLVFDDIPNTTE